MFDLFGILCSLITGECDIQLISSYALPYDSELACIEAVLQGEQISTLNSLTVESPGTFFAVDCVKRPADAT